MATVYWEPKAAAVAQAATIEISAFDAATTYSLAVNNVTIAALAGNSTANQTATDLATAWNASTHIYASGVTAATNAANITFAGDVAEVPFTVAGNVSGGNGTIGNFTISTAPTGSHTLTEADNWSSGAIPSDGDTIVFADSAVSALWDLDGLTTGNHTLVVEGTYSGSIGLDRSAVETAAAGAGGNTTAPEYRTRYLTLDCTRIEIGGYTGSGRPSNSPRVLINNDRAGASQTVVYNTRPAGDDSNQTPVRLLFAHASADIDLRAGFVSVGLDAPAETATVGDVVVTNGSFFCGAGVTMGTYKQRNGDSALDIGAATVTSVSLHGGVLQIEGDQVITTLNVWDGRCHCATTGNVTTANARGGRLAFTSAEAHTVPTLNVYRGATVEYDPDVTTVTTLTVADDGVSAITVGDPRG